MRRLGLFVRSTLLWLASTLHFFPLATLLILLGRAFEPRRFDPLVRLFVRNQVRLTGARLEVRRSPAFDPVRTYLFVCNHVNIFDPFVAYSTIPQFASDQVVAIPNRTFLADIVNDLFETRAIQLIVVVPLPRTLYGCFVEVVQYGFVMFNLFSNVLSLFKA